MKNKAQWRFLKPTGYTPCELQEQKFLALRALHRFAMRSRSNLRLARL